MFCKNCGSEMPDGADFCANCGTKLTEALEVESIVKKGKKSGIFSKIWNHPFFNMLAVRFGHILEILGGILFFLLGCLLYSEGGISGILFGVFFVFCGILVAINGVISLIKPNAKEETEEGLQKKKRNLCIGIVVLVIVFMVWRGTGGGVYSNVKSVKFDNDNSTIGEIIENSFRGEKWSKEKIDGSTIRVFVEGYCPSYDEDVRITFLYEKKDDSYYVSLKSIALLESGVESSNALELAVAWAVLQQ